MRKGTHHSEESKRKLSLASTGVSRPCEEQTRRKMSIAAKGKPHLWQIGVPFSTERKERISKALTGKKLSVETRAKISKNRKGIKISEEAVKRGIATKKANGYRLSEETKRKIGAANKGNIPRIPDKDTKIEVKMQNELSERGYGYYKHYPILGQPDIAFPDKKIAIFCDGCYWHSCNKCNIKNTRKNANFNRDKEVGEYLRAQGWFVLRYWEHEINANVEAAVDEIEDVLFSRSRYA